MAGVPSAGGWLRHATAAQKVLVGQVIHRRPRPTPPGSSGRGLLLDCPEGQERESHDDTVKSARYEVLPPVAPAQYIAAEGDQAVQRTGKHHGPEQAGRGSSTPPANDATEPTPAALAA